MKNIKILFDEKTIENKTEELANQLYEIYKDEPVIFICTLKGASFFTCDLAKKYKGDARLDFVRVSSYSGSVTTGNITLKIALNEENIKNQHIVIVEDIVDTGYTLEYLRNYILSMNPKSLAECTLLNKASRRKISLTPTYIGFEIDDLFVIGYGLDYDEKYRNLPYIGYIE